MQVICMISNLMEYGILSTSNKETLDGISNTLQYLQASNDVRYEPDQGAGSSWHLVKIGQQLLLSLRFDIHVKLND